MIPFLLDGRQPQFACAIDGISAQCTLDTGARDSISLMAPFMGANPQVVPKTLSAVGVTGFGFGGPAFGKLGRDRTVSFGSFTLPEVVGDFTTQQKGALAVPFVAANVGGGIWKRFSLTLDYGKQTMALIANPRSIGPMSTIGPASSCSIAAASTSCSIRVPVRRPPRPASPKATRSTASTVNRHHR